MNSTIKVANFVCIIKVTQKKKVTEISLYIISDQYYISDKVCILACMKTIRLPVKN